MERALRAGLQQGMQWLIHADPDELLYPENESFDIANRASSVCRSWTLTVIEMRCAEVMLCALNAGVTDSPGRPARPRVCSALPQLRGSA